MTTERFESDPTHSSVAFWIRHMVVAKVRGHFNKFDVVIDLDEKDVSRSTVDVKIDTASIDTGVEQRDNHLRSPDFFDVAKYPELRFTSKRVEDLGGGQLRVVGDLTMHGITKEVALEVENAGRAKDPWGGSRAGFSARATLDRKDFGLGWNAVLEAGGVLVGDKVSIEIEVEALHKTAAKAA
jgi:polyisoprenoid-binding protein YceI